MTKEELLKVLEMVPNAAEIWIYADHGQNDEPAYSVNYGLGKGELWDCPTCALESYEEDYCDDCEGEESFEWFTKSKINKDNKDKIKRVVIFS